MASKPDQQISKKKRIPKKYDHSLPPPEVDAHSRQNAHLNKVKDINLKRLENYMWCNPTLALTALFFNVSPDTIENTIRQHYALSFSDFRAQRIQHSKHSLIQKCMAMAHEQDDFRALKFALQNLAGWSESLQISNHAPQSIQLKYSLDKPPENPILDITPVKDPEIKNE